MIIFVSGVTGTIKVTKRTVKLFVNQCECFVSNVSYEMIVQRDSRKVKHVLRSKYAQIDSKDKQSSTGSTVQKSLAGSKNVTQ